MNGDDCAEKRMKEFNMLRVANSAYASPAEPGVLEGPLFLSIFVHKLRWQDEVSSKMLTFCQNVYKVEKTKGGVGSRWSKKHILWTQPYFPRNKEVFFMCTGPFCYENLNFSMYM